MLSLLLIVVEDRYISGFKGCVVGGCYVGDDYKLLEVVRDDSKIPITLFSF